MLIRLVSSALLTLLIAGCASPYSRSPAASDGYARCYDCGRVERIDRVYGQRQATGAGAVLGGIVGAVVGNQIGGGSGRDAATVAGAIAGGVAGNAIEKDVRSAPRYELFVHMDDGRRLVVTQPELGSIREGSYVRVSGGRARLLPPPR